MEAPMKESQPYGLPDEALATYLEQHLPGFRGPLNSHKFRGGQSNPTYLLNAESGRYVLRRKPPGTLLASAHAVDREFRVLQALHGGAVPVAEPLHLCVDDQIIGSMFYVMEFIEGRIFWDPSLPECSVDARARIYDGIIQTLAAIHSIPIGPAGLVDYGKPGNYFERQVGRWSEQYRASVTQVIPSMDALIDQLPGRCPADDGSIALVHGDFRIDNLMFEPDGLRVLAVVDWELSTLGHPLADLGYFCMALRLPRNPALPGLDGMHRAELGIPEENALLARYAELTGRKIPEDWAFVLAFSFFRLAAIAQGVAKRVQQGNASSAQAEQAGRMVELLAGLGLRELQK
jgi:aminoglycoside phosphotransferase (APT) family kinase protein